MASQRKRIESARDDAQQVSAPSKGHLTKRQIESAFDMLGLKSDADRAAFLTQWDSEGDKPASGRFLIKIGHSSEVFYE